MGACPLWAQGLVEMRKPRLLLSNKLEHRSVSYCPRKLFKDTGKTCPSATCQPVPLSSSWQKHAAVGKSLFTGTACLWGEKEGKAKGEALN